MDYRASYIVKLKSGCKKYINRKASKTISKHCNIAPTVLSCSCFRFAWTGRRCSGMSGRHVQSIPKRKQRLHCVSYPNVCLFYAIQRSNDSTKKRMQTLSHMCYLNRHETNLNTYLYLMLVAPMTVVTRPCMWHVYSVGHLSLSFGSWRSESQM